MVALRFVEYRLLLNAGQVFQGNLALGHPRSLDKLFADGVIDVAHPDQAFQGTLGAFRRNGEQALASSDPIEETKGINNHEYHECRPRSARSKTAVTAASLCASAMCC